MKNLLNWRAKVRNWNEGEWWGGDCEFFIINISFCLNLFEVSKKQRTAHGVFVSLKFICNVSSWECTQVRVILHTKFRLLPLCLVMLFNNKSFSLTLGAFLSSTCDSELICNRQKDWRVWQLNFWGEQSTPESEEWSNNKEEKKLKIRVEYFLCLILMPIIIRKEFKVNNEEFHSTFGPLIPGNFRLHFINFLKQNKITPESILLSSRLKIFGKFSRLLNFWTLKSSQVSIFD